MRVPHSFAFFAKGWEARMPAARMLSSGPRLAFSLLRGWRLQGRGSAEAVLYFARRMWPELLPFLPGPPL
jgi:hypothetical protein